MNNQVKKWEVLSKSTKSIPEILLKNRGIKTAKEKKEFFEPTTPEKLRLSELGISRLEVGRAIKRIKKALKSQEKVIIYGDYDADGICGTAILWEALYSLGLNVLPYIPERFTEGYGLNIESIRKLKTENRDLKLIITVDHGIVAAKKVDVAKELGIDVIITDHHQIGRTKPKALATVHTTKIGGAAVAWVLAREICRRMPDTRYQILDTLDLVAIGTIADQLPLIGPNRSFTKYGLKILNKTKRTGLLALLKESGLGSRPGLGPYEVGFLIAPRLNAMGRLEHAMESLRLLCTKDKKRAEELARHLNRVNVERQKILESVVFHAKSRLAEISKQKVIVLAHESYHEGVIGLAAGKLVDEFYKPSIVLSKKADVSKASARSIAGFNIIEAIRKLDDLILEGGGHPMAAGFSIETLKIEKFIERINEVSSPLLIEEVLARKLKIDLELHFNQLNSALVESIKSFEPTGLGNPAPTFATKDVSVENARVVGRDGKHLKLRLASPAGGQNSLVFEAIAFGMGGLYPKLSPGSKLDVAYNLEEDNWNGESRIQLKVKDLKVN